MTDCNRIIDEISERLDTLRSGALTTKPSGETWAEDEIQAAIAELALDLETIEQHNTARQRVVLATEEVHSAACGEPLPCSHLKAVAAKY